MIKDLLKNPITYWLRWVFNKKNFLKKNGRNNVKIDYLSHITNSVMEEYTTVYQNVRLHNSHLSSFTYVSNSSVLIGTKVGRFCSIGPGCRIGLGVHPTDFVSTHPIFYSKESHVGISFTHKNHIKEFEDVVIGNDVWIGANVIIKDGVMVGDGAIIAAGAVVTKNVPSYSVVGGVPAKLIRYRFDQVDIEKLLDIKWWDKDIESLRSEYTKYHNINDALE